MHWTSGGDNCNCHLYCRKKVIHDPLFSFQRRFCRIMYSIKPLLQALQIRTNKGNVLLTHLTYFWVRRYFQRSSFLIRTVDCLIRVRFYASVLTRWMFKSVNARGECYPSKKGKKVVCHACCTHLMSLSSFCFFLFENPIFPHKFGNWISDEKLCIWS